MILSNTWTALIVVGAISFLSTLLAIILYKYSSAVVQNKTMRLSGAIAIAWVLFLVMSKLYLSVSEDVKSQSTQQIEDKIAEVELQIKNYRECSLQVGEFGCKVPADELLDSCEDLIAILQMNFSNVWTALIVVGVISCLSTLLAIILYKHSSAVVQRKTMRLSGAIAIAWVMFLAMSKLYLSVSEDIKSQSTQQIEDKVAEVELQIKNYRECSLQVGEFGCKVPADGLLNSCKELIAIPH